MEPFQYDRVFAACLVAEEFLKEFPVGAESLSTDLETRIAQIANFKPKERVFKSHMSKLKNILLQYKKDSYGGIWERPKQVDFYVVTVLWLFKRCHLAYDRLEDHSTWTMFGRDSRFFTKTVFNTNPMSTRTHMIKVFQSSVDDVEKINYHLDRFDKILHAPQEERLRQLFAYKLTFG